MFFPCFIPPLLPILCPPLICFCFYLLRERPDPFVFMGNSNNTILIQAETNPPKYGISSAIGWTNSRMHTQGTSVGWALDTKLSIKIQDSLEKLCDLLFQGKCPRKIYYTLLHRTWCVSRRSSSHVEIWTSLWASTADNSGSYRVGVKNDDQNFYSDFK